MTLCLDTNDKSLQNQVCVVHSERQGFRRAGVRVPHSQSSPLPPHPSPLTPLAHPAAPSGLCPEPWALSDSHKISLSHLPHLTPSRFSPLCVLCPFLDHELTD